MHIPFKVLSNFSQLFVDFINKDEKLSRFFPSNYLIDKNELFELRLNQCNRQRDLFQNIIQQSINFELSTSQNYSFNLVNDRKTLFIITGQQPGIYGGPLYTLYKAFSAISLSEKYKIQYPNFNFVPVFWVEDSDDDVDEVNKYSFIDNNYDIHNLKLDNVKKRKLSHFEINESIDSILNNIINNSGSVNNSELVEYLKNVTNNNQLLADNFINSINFFTKENGLLFLKSSEVYKHKIYNEIILEDLLNPGKISNIIENINTLLIENHYSIQANSSDINFFCSRDDRRHKIIYTDRSYNINGKYYSDLELQDFIEKSDGIFTPKVLMRSIIQDYIFPTAAYIGGPGEIAYLSQLSEVYNYFNINMPIIEARHSFTIINNNITRTLEKENLELISLFRNYRSIEDEMANDLISSELENSFNIIESKLINIYNDVSPDILNIDKSLNTNIDITVNKSVELLNNLRKKVISQLKKKNEIRFTRILKSNRYIYPNNNLQERELNIYNLVNDTNYRELILQLIELTKIEPTQHFILQSKG